MFYWHRTPPFLRNKYVSFVSADNRWRGDARRSTPVPQHSLPPFLGFLPLQLPPVTVLVAGARSEGGAQVGQGRATPTARRHWGRSGRAGLGAAELTAVSLRRFLFVRESNRERNRRFGNGLSIRGNGEICNICCKFLPASWCIWGT